ncbi:INO80 complex subunit Ies4-domain-containing protein [Lipomyces kononenkoae]|uniref:INO80 complex subunit Ies4-domain-containing protein n=1 Tax=Lipomyces kononenkoae TaxID=34357 RepID=A0ACC3T333_LIPKO
MSRQSRSVVLKLNPQLLAQQEQAMNSTSLSVASSPIPPSSPLAPPTPPPGILSDIGTGAKRRKLGGTAGGGKRRKRPDTPSSPFITPSDPPTRPLSAMGGSPAPLDSGISSMPGTNGASTPTASSAQVLSHHAPHGKLGPKANQGSINAQLRALDRSGRPCRRWTKIPLELQSFTGWEWKVSAWCGGPREAQVGNMNSEVDQDDRKLETSSTAASANKDGNKAAAPPAPPAPPPLTITIPSLSTVSGQSKDSAKGDESSKKGSRRFPAILLRQSLDEFEA